MSNKDPDILVDLTSVATEAEGHILAASLRNAGVPAEVVGLASATLQWHLSATDPVRVQVRRVDFEKARRFMLDPRNIEGMEPVWPAGCGQCGYSLAGLKRPTICPECAWDEQILNYTTRSSNVKHGCAACGAALPGDDPDAACPACNPGTDGAAGEMHETTGKASWTPTIVLCAVLFMCILILSIFSIR